MVLSPATGKQIDQSQIVGNRSVGFRGGYIWISDAQVLWASDKNKDHSQGREILI